MYLICSFKYWTRNAIVCVIALPLMSFEVLQIEVVVVCYKLINTQCTS